MGTGDIIAIIAIVLIIGGAIAYIIKAKKSGKRCIGCPDSDSCKAGKCSGACHACACGCSSQIDENAEEMNNEKQKNPVK